MSDANIPNFESRQAAHEASLQSRFGALLTLTDLVIVLRYPSLRSVQMARARGQLPFPTTYLAARRQWFATAHNVAEFLARLDGDNATGTESAAMR